MVLKPAFLSHFFSVWISLLPQRRRIPSYDLDLFPYDRFGYLVDSTGLSEKEKNQLITEVPKLGGGVVH